MATLDEKKIKLQTRVRNIVRVHHQNHSTLMHPQAQANSETLITLIESCKKHNQLEICKQYIDQFQVNPTVEVPDFL
jgi:hypothetical protein